MSDGDTSVQLESKAPAEVQERAQKMGWIPPERYKGSPEKFVDADTYVENGETVLPILRANNRELHKTVTDLHSEVAQVRTALRESQEAIQAMKEYQGEEVKRQVEKARKELLAQIKQAKKDGDTDLEVDLQEELGKLDAAKVAAKENSTPVKATPKPVPVHPDYHAWEADNPWFGRDKKRTALVNAIAEEMRADPANNHLVGRAFFDECAKQMSSIMDKQERATSRVEGGTGGRGFNEGSSESRGFSSLPADARKACLERIPKMVGTGKPFKTEAEWKSHYAKNYEE